MTTLSSRHKFCRFLSVARWSRSTKFESRLFVRTNVSRLGNAAAKPHLHKLSTMSTHKNYYYMMRGAKKLSILQLELLNSISERTYFIKLIRHPKKYYKHCDSSKMKLKTFIKLKVHLKEFAHKKTTVYSFEYECACACMSTCTRSLSTDPDARQFNKDINID